MEPLDADADAGTGTELTWSRQASEAENIRVNSQMVRNLLDALRPPSPQAERRQRPGVAITGAVRTS